MTPDSRREMMAWHLGDAGCPHLAMAVRDSSRLTEAELDDISRLMSKDVLIAKGVMENPLPGTAIGCFRDERSRDYWFWRCGVRATESWTMKVDGPPCPEWADG